MKPSLRWYHAAQTDNHNNTNTRVMNRSNFMIFIGLLALMALTRTEYPDFSVIIPDASWAVFLLAGFFLRQARYFIIFALAAWGLDIFAFRADLAAAYCFTPGYIALVFTWMALWFGGRLVNADSARAPLLLTAVALPTAFVAFVISNLGYYLYSVYGETMTAMEYSIAIAKYLPWFEATTAAYASLVSASIWGVRQLQQQRLSQA